jgi:cysteine synthase A
MSKIYKGTLELVGNTPLVELINVEAEYELKANIYAKLECFNPSGSDKDRIAKAMIEDAEEKGLINEGATIIEPTSGNTGVGLAAIGAAKGYNVILTMPEIMTADKRKLLRVYGAKVVVSDDKKGMKGAIDKAEELASTIENSFIPEQFENPANPEAHRKTTGPEIWDDTDGGVDIFVAGVGTGGTITGVGEYLKSKNPDIKVVAVEPLRSPVLSGGKRGAHRIQGIGAGFVPKILNTKIYDEVIKVSDDEAMEYAGMLAKKEGILAGISSGAALYAAIKLAKQKKNAGKKIVVLLPDTGERYYSTALFK